MDVAGAQQMHCCTANTVNVWRRCRICAEGARFAERVLQSEPAQVNQLEDAGSDSDDAESESAANDSPISQPEEASAKANAPAVPTHATGEPPSASRLATEAQAEREVRDNGTAATLAAGDGPAAVAVGSPAQLHAASGADTTDAAATQLHSGGAAGAPVSVQTQVEDTAESTSCQVAPAASELPEAADAAENAAGLPAVLEADEQFEVLCRALLAASQLIATVSPLSNTVCLSGD